MSFDYDFDRIFDSIFSVTERNWKVVERKCVGMNFGCIKALLSHESFGTMGRAFALTTNAIKIDVVPDYVGNIDGNLLVGEGCKAHLPPRLTIRMASFTAFGAPEHSIT